MFFWEPGSDFPYSLVYYFYFYLFGFKLYNKLQGPVMVKNVLGIF